MEGVVRERKLERLLELQRSVKSVTQWRVLEAVWLREKLGLSGGEVSEALGYKLQSVHLIWSKWNRQGERLFAGPGPGGRKHAYLTVEQEGDFLKPFIARASEGVLVTVKEIHSAYEARVGKRVALSTIYRVLARHGWRKLVPRKKHPKGDREEQEKAKKN